MTGRVGLRSGVAVTASIALIGVMTRRLRVLAARQAKLADHARALESERGRLHEALSGAGASLTDTHSRYGLLEGFVTMVVGGVGATCGRATVRRELSSDPLEVRVVGDLVQLGPVLAAAEV